MSRRRALIAIAILAAGATVIALPLPTGKSGATADRKDFIPHRRHPPLPGKAIGVLVPDAQPVLTSEGRSGPKDQLCFAANGASYRWIYVQVERNPGIGNLMLPVGNGNERKRFERLSLATPATVKPFGLDGGFALVEVEVNGGHGSPADDSFVAARMTRLDGTKAFPLKMPEVVVTLRNKYAEFQKDNAKMIDEGMTKAAERSIQDQKPTGPREMEELMFVSWHSRTERLRVHFRSRFTDGAYKYAGGVNIELGPAPVPEGKPGIAPTTRLPNGLRYGKQFGVEFGMAYDVSKDGTLQRSLPLVLETFARELPAPPVFQRRDPRLPVKK